MKTSLNPIQGYVYPLLIRCSCENCVRRGAYLTFGCIIFNIVWLIFGFITPLIRNDDIFEKDCQVLWWETCKIARIQNGYTVVKYQYFWASLDTFSGNLTENSRSENTRVAIYQKDIIDLKYHIVIIILSFCKSKISEKY